MTIVKPISDFVTGSDLLSASENKTIDTIQLSRTKYAKWVIYLDTSSKSRTLEIVAVEKSSTAKHSVYGIVGDSIQYNISVESDGTDMTLELINNESEDLTVKFKRLITN